MAGEYTRWYRVGTVAVGNGSTSVVGTNTYWLTAGLNPGDIFSLDGVNDYEIFAITDNTHLTLKTAYTGSSASGATYHIIRNFTAHVPSQLAAQLSELYGDLARYWDQDTQTIHGKSAYEIACANGYVGTEAQWVEYLRNGGGYTDLVKLTTPLNTTNGNARNCLLRGKNHGTITVSKLAEWVAAIRAGTYGDLYLGDTFGIQGVRGAFTVWGFNEFRRRGSHANYPKHVICYVYNPYIPSCWNGTSTPVPWNTTNTYEGGYLGSNLNAKFQEWIGVLEETIGTDKLVTLDNFAVADQCDSSGNFTHYTTFDTKVLAPSWMMTHGRSDLGTAFPMIQKRLSLFNYGPPVFWHPIYDTPGKLPVPYTGEVVSCAITHALSPQPIVLLG